MILRGGAEMPDVNVTFDGTILKGWRKAPVKPGAFGTNAYRCLPSLAGPSARSWTRIPRLAGRIGSILVDAAVVEVDVVEEVDVRFWIGSDELTWWVGAAKLGTALGGTSIELVGWLRPSCVAERTSRATKKSWNASSTYGK